MELDLAQQRQEAHFLIDALSQEKLSAVYAILHVLVDPFSKSLALAP